MHLDLNLTLETAWGSQRETVATCSQLFTLVGSTDSTATISRNYFLILLLPFVLYRLRLNQFNSYRFIRYRMFSSRFRFLPWLLRFRSRSPLWSRSPRRCVLFIPRVRLPFSPLLFSPVLLSHPSPATFLVGLPAAVSLPVVPCFDSCRAFGAANGVAPPSAVAPVAAVWSLPPRPLLLPYAQVPPLLVAASVASVWALPLRSLLPPPAQGFRLRSSCTCPLGFVGLLPPFWFLLR